MRGYSADVATPKRTSLNIDEELITAVKLAVLEAKMAGVEAPRNVSSFATEALTRELAALRQKIEKARPAKK